LINEKKLIFLKADHSSEKSFAALTQRLPHKPCNFLSWSGPHFSRLSSASALSIHLGRVQLEGKSFALKTHFVAFHSCCCCYCSGWLAEWLAGFVVAGGNCFDLRMVWPQLSGKDSGAGPKRRGERQWGGAEETRT